MTEGTCQYCGKLTTLIEAHIVPRAFYPLGSIQVLSIDTPRTRRHLGPELRGFDKSSRVVNVPLPKVW